MVNPLDFSMQLLNFEKIVKTDVIQYYCCAGHSSSTDCRVRSGLLHA
jgi:hypothetical protein